MTSNQRHSTTTDDAQQPDYLIINEDRREYIDPTKLGGGGGDLWTIAQSHVGGVLLYLLHDSDELTPRVAPGDTDLASTTQLGRWAGDEVAVVPSSCPSFGVQAARDGPHVDVSDEVRDELTEFLFFGDDDRLGTAD